MEMSIYLGVSIKNPPCVQPLMVARGFNVSSKPR